MKGRAFQAKKWLGVAGINVRKKAGRGAWRRVIEIVLDEKLGLYPEW